MEENVIRKVSEELTLTRFGYRTGNGLNTVIDDLKSALKKTECTIISNAKLEKLISSTAKDDTKTANERKEVINKTYLVTVDYAISVEEMIKKGHYDWINQNITSKNFPVNRKSQKQVYIVLIHLNRYVSTKNALIELGNMGYEPADLYQLLALGAKYPDLQRKFQIVALDPTSYRPYSAPYLCGGVSDRRLYLESIGNNWPEFWYFAVTHK